MEIKFSKRLKNLPPYLFVEIDKAKREARKRGRDLIDLGIGDPDLPTPGNIIEKLYQASKDPRNHKYALDQGMPVLRQAIADWYKRRFNVDLNPETQILPLIGSKEGIAHMPLAFVNRGEYVLSPNPSYPPYRGSAILSDGKVQDMPLLEKNNFLPDFKKIPLPARKKAKLMFLNYPNNPTGAIADAEFYRKAIDFASKYNIIIAHDAAYSEMSYDGYKPMSFLEVEGAKDTGVEFHSLSKTYNMTGWRIGWVCGNAQVVSGIAKVKSNIDSGIFSAIQIAGLEALSGPQEHIQKMRAIYQERRDVLCAGLKSIGWNFLKPEAAFYVWVSVPKGYDSRGFAALLLEKCDIVVTPGVGFGKCGEGYIRFALTVSKERVQEAMERIQKRV
ncbi:MAG: LL-diaminopimelate aminotransferase [Omnitrophica WOR_2 bacterium RIFOXYC2_FULL_45_15]|nr:MAG: LL-diaminopimelate aminotransferase [Omnitrophica WOR_2 bacterium RIFOXYC2_FULL_45_15]